jgi:hypothetical protein
LHLKECGVTFEYLPGKKIEVADVLSCLDNNELTFPQEEALAILPEYEHSNITFPMHTSLIFKEQIKVPGLKEKGLSQSYYSKQHIGGYDLVCYKDKIYILQFLRHRILSWYYEYLLHSG